ncbi:MAG TPA: hypothetical protein V6D47_11360, partial [Oscillatoriaceae cyanobacterium]
ASQPLPETTPVVWPQAGDPLGWADALAHSKEPEQQAALEAMLEALHAGAREAAALGTRPEGWLTAAHAVEGAREALRGHLNARLLFDRLAGTLVRAGLVENAPLRVIR